jgi:hypothetical protein
MTRAVARGPTSRSKVNTGISDYNSNEVPKIGDGRTSRSKGTSPAARPTRRPLPVPGWPGSPLSGSSRGICHSESVLHGVLYRRAGLHLTALFGGFGPGRGEAGRRRPCGGWATRRSSRRRGSARTPASTTACSRCTSGCACRRARRAWTKFSSASHTTAPPHCCVRLALAGRCATFEVDGETRAWEAGKVLVFDDSFEHQVSHGP